MTRLLRKQWMIFVLMFCLAGTTSLQAAMNKEEVGRIALQAYMYTYPMVLMDVTRRQMTNMPAGKKTGRAPMMQFAHMREFPPADFKEVVRPNFDTLYSPAWVDLSKEPVVLSVPEVKDRFYMLPMLDMWTDVFAVVGTYGTGTGAGNYLIALQGWEGKVPDGMQRINAPTSIVWILGRTQTNGPRDYEYIHKIQDGFRIVPLSSWGKDYKPGFRKDSSVDDKTPPLNQVQNMSGKEFFTYAMSLMKQHPPHVTDMVMVNRMKRIGLDPEGFDYDKLPAETRAALDEAARISHDEMKKYMARLGENVNGWQMVTKSIGVYGNDYLQRATVNLVGLGANPYEQAVYPLNLADADGNVPMGGKKYMLHFSKEELPPVDAFWSLTMYDEEGFQVANELNRFAIGDRDELKFNKDGSLDIYIQHESPGKDKESNWLPSPAEGKLGMTLRLYAPHQSVLDGSWKPPVVKPVK
ncbi:DUF1254 domain-containing protein [Thiolapillus sp.]